MIESIVLEPSLAVYLGGSPEREDKVLLNPPEVVFRLGVCEAKYGARVGSAEHVRDAVSIAIDRDAASERVPRVSRLLLRLRKSVHVAEKEPGNHRQKENERR